MKNAIAKKTVIDTPAETTVEVVTLTAVQSKKMGQFERWSDKFRYLASEGIATKDIAKITGKRYQQVRNTLVTPLKGK
ncbi:MAG: hypothetical protein COA78_28425 [Blastopirellula sp.]|nr:MAG: hypothetical protein COA78_28425 [Blastopirellula sp.]